MIITKKDPSRRWPETGFEEVARIGNEKLASDDVCFGVGRDKLSGWLILDPHYRADCDALGDLPCSDHDAQALSTAKTCIKEATQMRPRLV